jgi:glycosyltransferase involved in cell wall biosynthesis
MLIDNWFPSAERGVGHFGGSQVHVKELKNYLETKNDCTVTLFYQSRSFFLFQIFWPILAFIDVLLYSRYHHIDVLHSHGLRSGLAAKMLSLLLKIPVVHTVHAYPHLDHQPASLQGWFEKLVLTRIAYTGEITVSRDFLKFPNVNHDVQVIPNGIDVHRFDRVKAVKSPYPSLIWVGKNDPSKGLPVLKTAIAKVRKKIPQLQAELITDGQVTGVDLIRAYKRAHLFVLASHTESQPISLLEAWAAKLPVVVTKVGDNPLMVKHGVNGYLVEPGNAQQLAVYLLKVLRGYRSAGKLGEAGYRYVLDHYSWGEVAHATYKYYLQILKTRPTLSTTPIKNYSASLETNQ